MEMPTTRTTAAITTTTTEGGNTKANADNRNNNYGNEEKKSWREEEAWEEWSEDKDPKIKKNIFCILIQFVVVVCRKKMKWIQ